MYVQAGTGWTMSFLSISPFLWGHCETDTVCYKAGEATWPELGSGRLASSRETCPMHDATSQCQLYDKDKAILLSHPNSLHSFMRFVLLYNEVIDACNYCMYIISTSSVLGCITQITTSTIQKVGSKLRLRHGFSLAASASLTVLCLNLILAHFWIKVYKSTDTLQLSTYFPFKTLWRLFQEYLRVIFSCSG